MPFGELTPKKEDTKMPLNTCKILIKNYNQATTRKGTLCTNDVELYVLMRTCPSETLNQGEV
jgi:hypothetical protein